MSSAVANSDVGLVKVFTTVSRGYTPEEIAARAIDKIIYVGEQSHPLLREQALAYKDRIHAVLVHYLREAQESERLTVSCKLSEQGLDEIADLIRRL